MLTKKGDTIYKSKYNLFHFGRPEIFSSKALDWIPAHGEMKDQRKKIFEQLYFKELNDFHQTAVQR